MIWLSPRRPVVQVSGSIISGGGPRHNKHYLVDAVHASLERLQTEYIDLYQCLADRQTNYWGAAGIITVDDVDETPIDETLNALRCLSLIAVKFGRSVLSTGPRGA